MALGAIAGQLAWMYPDGKLASGAVKGNASLVTISMWLSTIVWWSQLRAESVQSTGRSS